MGNDGLSILSSGYAAGSRVVTNEDFARIVDTSDEWIRSRTGIVTRHFGGEGESTTTLALSAARSALEKAGISKEKIAAIICATMSADHATPSTACLLQRELSLPENIAAIDVNAACSGFVAALLACRSFLTDERPYAIVIGAEQLSRLLDFTDRTTCVLFGDGAGAVVVRKAEVPFGSCLFAKGGTEILAEGAGPEVSHIRMDGRAVFRFAVEALPAAMKQTLKNAGLSVHEIDHIVCHQANERILEHVIKKEQLEDRKVYRNIDHFGNTSAASIPMAIGEMEERGLLKTGESLLLMGFGAGLTAGGVVVFYGGHDEDTQ